jgi:hypothetical protein
MQRSKYSVGQSLMLGAVLCTIIAVVPFNTPNYSGDDNGKKNDQFYIIHLRDAEGNVYRSREDIVEDVQEADVITACIRAGVAHTASRVSLFDVTH